MISKRWSGIGILAVALGAPASAGSPGQVRQAALARIPLARAIAEDSVLVEAVRKQNASGLTLEQVRGRDKDWTQDAQSPRRKEVSGNACARRLRELIAPDSLVVEAIVMDAQGASVCVSQETSDYWQGDEAKFQLTFGADRDVFVDEPAQDASSGTFAIQLSVLLRDGGRKAGAVTLSLRVPAGEAP